MSNTVTLNAQMGNARVLKPPAGFEVAYQGLSAVDKPIALPGTLDIRAGKRGYDANLLAGVAVPMGSRLLLWLPSAFTSEGLSMPVYNWRILWRLRSSGDQAFAHERPEEGTLQHGLVGHLPQEFEGIPDTGAERIIIPCALSPIVYEPAEPAGVVDAVSNLRGEQIAVQGNSYGTSDAPVLVSDPTQVGIASQGVYPNGDADNGQPSGPTYLPYATECLGDEFLLIVNRSGVAWDFGGPDFIFSRIFGTANGTQAIVPGLGVYVMTGMGSILGRVAPGGR